MGKVEKIVVLSVLFLIAVILAVSLDSGGDGDALARGRGGADDEQAQLDPNVRDVSGDRDGREGRFSAPLDITDYGVEPSDDEALSSGTQTQGEIPAPEGGSRRIGSGGLLNAAVDTEAPAEPTERAMPVAAGDLVSLAGLEETISADLMAYTCADGDTFKKAAARFYGDGSKAELLRRYNEGVRELSAGHVLFVPIHDDGYGSVQEYVVLEGESLWVVAKNVYGKGHLWTEIWEANKDRLKSPDSVRAGDVLRIP